MESLQQDMQQQQAQQQQQQQADERRKHMLDQILEPAAQERYKLFIALLMFVNIQLFY